MKKIYNPTLKFIISAFLFILLCLIQTYPSASAQTHSGINGGKPAFHTLKGCL
ncbi:MAG: hypothetical protein XD50_1093 [Clostridia bacterium 41_269]|nr:MAG: hypothetical protein XD50_1093 [Clostridia bacterium 41_269]